MIKWVKIKINYCKIFMEDGFLQKCGSDGKLNQTVKFNAILEIVLNLEILEI